MNVASLELSKDLSELSGWKNTVYWWRLHKPSGRSKLYTFDEMDHDNFRFRNSPEAVRFKEENDFYPAYEVGYLLQKLPQSIDNKEYGYRWRWHLTPLGEGGHGYNIGYQNDMWVTAHKSSWKRKGLDDEEIEQLIYWRPPHWSYEAEDVVAKLAIELFKQGILTRVGE